jgi:hypothetical protein
LDRLSHLGRLGDDGGAASVGELGPSRDRRDADALLAAAATAAAELGAGQVFAENLDDIFDFEAGTVVLDPNPDRVGVLPRPLADLFDEDRNLGQNAGVLAGVERVIDGFLDGRQDRLGVGREADLLEILRKILGAASRGDRGGLSHGD